jgi:hypothetical protein
MKYEIMLCGCHSLRLASTLIRQTTFFFEKKYFCKFEFSYFHNLPLYFHMKSEII